MNITKFWLRVTGIFGVLGGLILFAGDMLFYYDASSTDLLQNMSKVSDLRIILSGITALLGTWLYLLGLFSVYYAFKPATSIMRNIVIISFASILVAYGVIHGAYVGIATTAKLSLQNNLDITMATALVKETNLILRLFVYPSFAVLSFVFIFQVWKQKTLYPRWIIFFFPLIPFLFQGLFSKFLTGSIRIIIVGGFLNIILIIFFTASTIALWNKKLDKHNLS